LHLNKKYKLAMFLLLPVGVILLVLFIARSHGIAVLQPEGLIAHKEYRLLVFASLLSALVVVPVFAMMFYIAWKYREGNPRAKYSPDWDHDRRAETVWWGLPLVLILILSVVTWQTSHDLDPFRPINSNVKPVTIQVVAMQWKWLFIYPEQNIASVNYVQFPANTPINFEITADAPMNSFWIPKLGGQMYAMSGMSTELHLMADQPGTYEGVSANISGKGFADMHFIARSSSSADFDKWVDEAKTLTQTMDMATYDQLSKPSENVSPTYYASADENLYHYVMSKPLTPGFDSLEIN
jgi:cytochrome o ubiquinol oxidase subunit 2